MAASYKVYFRTTKPALRCAIRKDFPLPDFIDPEAWEFLCNVKGEVAIPGGFQPAAAHEAMRLTGYYVFTELGRRSVEPGSEIVGVRQASAAWVPPGTEPPDMSLPNRSDTTLDRGRVVHHVEDPPLTGTGLNAPRGPKR